MFFVHIDFGRANHREGPLLLSTLAGLFLSEIIECSQLIWQRGTFDVNDLLNNTVGALLGGVAVVLVLAWRRRGKNVLG